LKPVLEIPREMKEYVYSVAPNKVLMQKNNKTACQRWQEWVHSRHERAIQALEPRGMENNDEQNIKNENGADRSPNSTARNWGRMHMMTVAHGIHLPSIHECSVKPVYVEGGFRYCAFALMNRTLGVKGSASRAPKNDKVPRRRVVSKTNAEQESVAVRSLKSETR
jgi:hypothetical protein